jgi:O-antigen ligase
MHNLSKQQNHLFKFQQLNYLLILFCLGWGMILLLPILPILPDLQTFILPWRAEFVGAILFTAVLLYLFVKNPQIQLEAFSREELYFIVLPIFVFIVWSILSITWAESPKAVLHHTIVWFLYLLFYLTNRFLLQSKKAEEISLIIVGLAIAFIGIPPILEYAAFVAESGNSTIGLRYSKYAELVNVVFPVFFAWTLHLKGKKFWLGFSTLIIIELLVISSVSRAGLILFCFSVMGITVLSFVVKNFFPFRKRVLAILLGFAISAVAIHTLGFLNKSTIPMIGRVTDESTSISTNVRPFFVAVSWEMIKDSPIIGFGADNFGILFDKFRAEYADKNPTSEYLAIAEGEIPERAHNEYFQILAELGAVGLGIFAFLLIGIGCLYLKALKNWRQTSLLSFASLLGLTTFLVSSLVSSYSFRLMQNGFIFFFVLAIATCNLFKDEEKTFDFSLSKMKFIKPASLAAAIICLLCVGFSLLRVASVYQTNRAAGLTDISESTPVYQKAISLDSENAHAYFYFGMSLLNAGKFQESATQFEKALSLGRISTMEISLLVSSQVLAGNRESAEKTLQKAIKMYPYSIFLRTRYAVLLNEMGKNSEADEQFKKALSINEKHANTWFSLMNNGSLKTSIEVSKNPQMTSIMSLSPQPTIYAFLIEREIKYPEEKEQIRH